MYHPVPPEHLKHIGDLTVTFALLEMNIQSFTAALIFEHQRVGQIITAEVSFKNLRALNLSLYRERHGEDEDFERIKKLMIEAGEVEEIRNQIMHSVWGTGKDADHITRIKTTAKEKHGLRFQFEELSSSNLADYVTRIRNCAAEVQKLRMELIKTGKIINTPISKTW